MYKYLVDTFLILLLGMSRTYQTALYWIHNPLDIRTTVLHALVQYSSGVLPEKACFSTVLNTSLSHFASFKTPAIPSAFELCNHRPVSAQYAPVIMAKITPHLSSPGELETYKIAAVGRFLQILQLPPLQDRSFKQHVLAFKWQKIPTCTEFSVEDTQGPLDLPKHISSMVWLSVTQIKRNVLCHGS